MHTAKTGGSTLREIISSGAASVGIPSNQQFIPCHNGLDCSTFNLPHKNYSIIAGHFTWRELERVGLQDFDCVVSVRRPLDRVVSCLSYFTPRAVMESVHTMNRQAFRRLITEQTSCNNGMLAMLMPSLVGMDSIQESMVNNNLNTTTAQTILQAALDNMRNHLRHVERLNVFDAIIFDAALKQMRQQHLTDAE
ncbi:g6641 [Coccomyxa viridis]|uniref:G6641 protein n=1 Tax=Coccomyxa viridis TaxID=1274662 RepID=A0ABP1FX32_9CHLO